MARGPLALIMMALIRALVTQATQVTDGLQEHHALTMTSVLMELIIVILMLFVLTQTVDSLALVILDTVVTVFHVQMTMNALTILITAMLMVIARIMMHHLTALVHWLFW